MMMMMMMMMMMTASVHSAGRVTSDRVRVVQRTVWQHRNITVIS